MFSRSTQTPKKMNSISKQEVHIQQDPQSKRYRAPF